MTFFVNYGIHKLNMSTNYKVSLLKPSQVSKQIIAKSPKTRSNLEWFDHLGKYRDEHLAEYNEKKNEFLAVASAYNKANNDTLRSRKIMVHRNYEEMQNLDFLKEKERGEDEACDPFCCCLKCTPNKTGKLLRKRSLRSVSRVRTKASAPKLDVCITEPWFERYLTLNKFIIAARTIIIQNRLLKVLKKLKKLTRENDKALDGIEIEKRCEEFHCHPVFLKFL